MKNRHLAQGRSNRENTDTAHAALSLDYSLYDRSSNHWKAEVFVPVQEQGESRSS